MSEIRICPLTKQECEFGCKGICSAEKDVEAVTNAVIKTLQRTTQERAKSKPVGKGSAYITLLQKEVVKILNR